MSRGTEHPAHYKAELLFTQAEIARREHNTSAARTLEQMAARLEAEAARAATDAADRASLWRSAVAFAYHGGDREQLLALAQEALTSTSDPYATQVIRELLGEAVFDEPAAPRSTVRLQGMWQLRNELRQRAAA